MRTSFKAAYRVVNLNHELSAEDLMKELLIDYVEKTYPEEYIKECEDEYEVGELTGAEQPEDENAERSRVDYENDEEV